MAGPVAEALVNGQPMPQQRRLSPVAEALAAPSPIGRSATPPSPELMAQMDREEAEGAGNLLQKWTEYGQLRMAADDAVRRYQSGQGSASEAAAVIERYNHWTDQNRHWLEYKPVNPQPRPWWQFWGGS